MGHYYEIAARQDNNHRHWLISMTRYSCGYGGEIMLLRVPYWFSDLALRKS